MKPGTGMEAEVAKSREADPGGTPRDHWKFRPVLTVVNQNAIAFKNIMEVVIVCHSYKIILKTNKKFPNTQKYNEIFKCFNFEMLYLAMTSVYGKICTATYWVLLKWLMDYTFIVDLICRTIVPQRWFPRVVYVIQGAGFTSW